MATIDFPASPVNGQVFNAPNGVSYIWNAASTVWVTRPLLAGFVGDFVATGGAYAQSLSQVVVPFGTVIQGNVGGYWNTSLGRYTPPQGRYFIGATVGTQAPVGGNGTWTLALRKNGVTVPGVGTSSSGSAQFSIPITIGAVVDANGTDYFEIGATQGAAGMNAQGGFVFAFPIMPNIAMTQNSGDFFATNFNTAVGGQATVLFNTILTGNSGGWYNPANGRWTPPAGRYYIWSTVSSGATGAASVVACYLRKNGSVIISGSQVPGTAGWWGDPSVAAVLDMNGTDWIDIQASNSGAGGTVGNLWSWFGAYPISGIQGPAGPAGPSGAVGGAFNVRATANDTISGSNNINLFRSLASPVEDWDPDGAWDNSTGVYTALVTGRYHFAASLYAGPSAPVQTMIAIQHQQSNGTPIRTYGVAGTADGNVYGANKSITIDIQMNANERVIFLWAANGTATTAASGTIGGLAANSLVWACGNRMGA